MEVFSDCMILFFCPLLVFFGLLWICGLFCVGYLDIFSNSKPVLFPFQQLPIGSDLRIELELNMQ